MDQVTEAIRQLTGLSLWISAILALIVSGVVGVITFFATRRYESGLALKNEREIENLRKEHTKEIEELRSGLDAQVRRTQVFLDTSMHVRRAQFEVEFRAYQEIWPKVTWLRVAALNLRPVYEVRDSADTLEEHRNKKYKVFSEAYNAVSLEIEDLSPFYNEEIHRMLVDFRESARQEGIFFEYMDEATPQEKKESREKRDEIPEKLIAVGAAIRRRLSEIVIVE